MNKDMLLVYMWNFCPQGQELWFYDEVLLVVHVLLWNCIESRKSSSNTTRHQADKLNARYLEQGKWWDSVLVFRF